MASEGHELMPVSGEELHRKKRCHHTQHQIQKLEEFFKENPHPDVKQKEELSQKLGLELVQVKFWFQNKCTQFKVQQERAENAQLRAENAQLRAESTLYKAPSTSIEPFDELFDELSFDEDQLRSENMRLQQLFGGGPH